jgi:FO synthase subunit 1
MTQIITYSPSYTIVPTYECFNKCSYCNFRVDPDRDPWITLEIAKLKLESLANKGISEILILSGEVHPRSPKRKSWFELIYRLCECSLIMGFLPHSNVGPLRYSEMLAMKEVNVSMGLMLEQSTSKLLTKVHKNSPSKIPQLRIEQLEIAGKLKIPFTTGLLLGIGETEADWEESLKEIARIHRTWGHIQEVILQPYSPGKSEIMKEPGFNRDRLPIAIAKAREILPESITIQIPPNLLPEKELLLKCIAAGARDLGGISPKDEVNPNYPHHREESLRAILEAEGWELKTRLPVYPQYYKTLPRHLQTAIDKFS